MSNENKSIHEFDINLIWEYFSNLEQQGPGSPEATDSLHEPGRPAGLGRRPPLLPGFKG